MNFSWHCFALSFLVLLFNMQQHVLRNCVASHERDLGKQSRHRHNSTWHLNRVYSVYIKWARSCENVSYGICEQQRCWNFKTLASRSSWADRFESHLVENVRRHIFAWCGSNEQNAIKYNKVKEVRHPQTSTHPICKEREPMRWK